MKKRKAKSVRKMREATLDHLAGEYKDALLLTGELRRAIDSMVGEIPEDSPQRYLRLDVGDAVLSFLSRAGKAKRVPDVVKELEAGGCLFGVVKTPREIVTKVIKAYMQSGRLVWMDQKQTLVGLPGWKRRP